MLYIRQHLRFIVATLIMCAFVITGHCLFYFITIPAYSIIRIIEITLITILCLFGMIFILYNSRNVRSRKVFAFQLGMFALAGFFTLVRVITLDGHIPEVNAHIMSPAIIIYGNTYSYICLLYPIVLLHVGKIRIKDYFILFSPVLVLGMFYYMVIYLFNLSITVIDSWRDLVLNINRFDVYFRFTIFLYPILLIIKILNEKVKYEQWCYDNYSDSGYINLSWINYYLIGYIFLLCSYIILIFTQNMQSTIMHDLCFIIFFGFCLYSVIKQTIPPAADMQNYALNGEKEITLSENDTQSDELFDQNRYRFVDMMPQYKIKLEEWMDRDKPYLNKDFKLIDVMNVLPLNRSYLSRMFNDLYGETFLSFVMRYRIKESTHLLSTRSDITISYIALICGFSSPSVFGRAFLKIYGVTPKQYRMSHIHKDENAA